MIIKRVIKRIVKINEKLSMKFLVIFIGLVVVPSTLLGLFYFNYISKDIVKDTLNNSWNNLQPVEKQLSSRLEVINRTFSGMYNDDDFVSIISRINSEQTWGEQFDDFTKLDKILNQYASEDLIYQIRIYLSDDKFYSNQNTRFCSNQILKDMGLMDREDYGTSIIWIVNDEFKETKFSDPISLVSAFFTYDNKDDDTITIEIDILQEKIVEILDLFFLYEKSNIFIVSDENRIVSSKEDKLVNKAFDQKSIVEGITYKDNEYYLKKNLSDYDWSLVVNGDAGGLSRKNNFIQTSILLFVVQITLAFMVTSFFFFSMNKRLHVLRDSMNDIDEYIVMKPITTKSNDEIDQLVKYYLKMMDRIRKLIEDIYISNQEKRQSELRLLLNQINPHFIYNMLETINWKAIDHKAYDVSKSINQLSKFLRMSLSISDSQITVKEEIDYLNLYVNMQKEAISRKIEFLVVCSDEILEYKVPRLIIQPIIENSIVHGILEKETIEDCLVKLDFIKDEKDLVVKVYDNGVGISKSKLKDIEKALLKEVNEKYFALLNINQRLKINYGDSYCINIKSEENNYTIVSFKIPIIP